MWKEGGWDILRDPAHSDSPLAHGHIMVSLLPLFLLFLRTEGTETSKPSDLPFVDYLDQDHLVRLSWGFDNFQGSITFELVVNTTGWVGFGLSPNGGMKGSDIVIGGIGPAGHYFAVGQHN